MSCCLGTILYVETKSSHAGLVLGDQVLALLLRVVALGEEHALVTRGLFVLANAAWLYRSDQRGAKAGED